VGRSIVRTVILRRISIGVFALLFGIALVLLRGEPWIGGDPGVFLSVAARLLDGDRLYADVFDNKDPLFFYTYAGALWLGGWRAPFWLDAVWLALAGISMLLLVREVQAPRSAVVVSFLVYPLALTAGWYLVGMSMLGGLAVAPLAPWLWLRRRYAAAGVVLVVVALLKLNLAPLAAAPLAPLLVLGAPEGVRRRALVRGALGLGGALVAAAAFLGIRGELRAYLETIEYNVHYSSARTTSDGLIGRTVDHFQVVTEFFQLAGRWQLPAAILVLAAFGVVLCIVVVRGSRSERLLAGVAATTLLAALAVLALTAYSLEHLQLLAYPATLIATAFIWRAHASLGRRAGTVAAAAVVLFALWSSLKVPGGTEVSMWWTSNPISPGAVALERDRERFRPDARHVTYMVLGSNSENGHAAFLGPGFDLTCRDFHLYAYSRQEQFDETRRCAEQKKPTFVLVTLGFYDPPYGVPAWDEFIASAKRLLKERYELIDEEPPGFQVWKRRSG
jgi:hypothetical protein